MHAPAVAAAVLASLAPLARASPFTPWEAPDAHGLTGGQIVIIASVGILGIVCLVISGIVGCVLCARIEYRDRAARRQWADEQDLIVSASVPCARPGGATGCVPREGGRPDTAVPKVTRVGEEHAS